MDVLYMKEAVPASAVEVVIHDDLKYEPNGWFEKTLNNVGESTEHFFKSNRRFLRILLIVLFNGGVLGFFFACFHHWYTGDREPLELCFGFGSLIAFLSIIYFFVIYFTVLKRYFGEWFERAVWVKVEDFTGFLFKFVAFRIGIVVVILTAIAIFLIFDTIDNRERLISLLGLFVLLFLGLLLSAYPTRVNWRSVGAGLFIQFLFGLIFIRWDAGRMALQCFSDKNQCSPVKRPRNTYKNEVCDRRCPEETRLDEKKHRGDPDTGYPKILGVSERTMTGLKTPGRGRPRIQDCKDEK
ncbi:hypothetical protein EVAR_50094_1 [Eumeta japonica]|uniref:Concentrative nucleoside transporter N-terminal domain-containing protein n=1 Tax=Eumeta variegata TaxID=151549 RepID=A0A4C1XX42_EUMVA|nr:hypothetical protein EVAR_50094_1 [Eumeta japonica]